MMHFISRFVQSLVFLPHRLNKKKMGVFLAETMRDYDSYTWTSSSAFSTPFHKASARIIRIGRIPNFFSSILCVVSRTKLFSSSLLIGKSKGYQFFCYQHRVHRSLKKKEEGNSFGFVYSLGSLLQQGRTLHGYNCEKDLFIPLSIQFSYLFYFKGPIFFFFLSSALSVSVESLRISHMHSIER